MKGLETFHGEVLGHKAEWVLHGDQLIFDTSNTVEIDIKEILTFMLASN